MNLKKLYFFILSICTVLSATAQGDQQAQNLLNKANNASFFIENKGQWPNEVLYLTRIGGLDAWITKTGVVYDFYQLKEVEKPSPKKEVNAPHGKFEHTPMQRYGQVVKLNLLNTQANPIPNGKQKQKGYFNYFLGNDQSKWASYVGLYQEAVVSNLYNGIDARYYFENNLLRYDYIIQPGANLSDLKFTVAGSDYHINKNGELVYETRFGEVKNAQLYIYQTINGKQVEVKGQFTQNNEQLGFTVENYNPAYPLIIDPLIYSTFIGGSVGDVGNALVLDNAGNVVVTGEAVSSNYPKTTGAYDQTFNGVKDVFVTKLNSTGSTLIYSTFIGGSNLDSGSSLALDNTENAVITGWTYSTNYPSTIGAYNQTNNGGSDVFVTKLNATGSALIYSTFIGGTGDDFAFSLALDNTNNTIITGYAISSNYPTTTGAYDQTYNGSWDIFVTKLNPTGSALIYSTYIGGADYDIGYSLAIDNNDNAVVTGITYSTNYPTSVGAYDQTFNGGTYDLFVTKLNVTGSALIYSTYIGGSNWDSGNSITLDNVGNAIVTGSTKSANYPSTTGAYDETHNGDYDVFVTKLNVTGSALIYSTFIGDLYWDYGNSIALDNAGNIVITGYTRSANYPSTTGAYDQTYNGGLINYDLFVTKLNATASVLLYSTFIGGASEDVGYSLAIDNNDNAVITGYTFSTNYPTTTGAYDQTHNGGADVFVTKLDFCIPATGTDVQTACGSYTWIDGNTYTTSNNTATYTYVSGAANGCDSVVTLDLTITPNPDVTVTTNGATLTSNANVATYQWVSCPNYTPISGQTAQSFTATQNGSYAVIVTQGSCTDTSSCYAISTFVGLQENNSNTNLVNIYPNPNTGAFTISTQHKGLNITVYSLDGKIILNPQPLTNNNQPININHAAKGVYFVDITGEKMKQTYKIVVK